MTNAQPIEDIERRLSRLERLMSSNGELLLQTASLARRNAADFDRILALFGTAQETLNRVAAVTERNALDIEALKQEGRALDKRIDSLTAASERHDRILDYLLRREAGDIDTE
ncbi:MAG: hypothetical protein ACFB0E_06270 [Leptolyngbyaceae cyanobacterium]